MYFLQSTIYFFYVLCNSHEERARQSAYAFLTGILIANPFMAYLDWLQHILKNLIVQHIIKHFFYDDHQLYLHYP